MPGALIDCESREAITPQRIEFLRRFFGGQVVTANAACLLPRVEEHHKFQLLV
jgi:hypothetical protein